MEPRTRLILTAVVAAAAVFALAGCGTIDMSTGDNGGGGGGPVTRRLFVSDPAANDSLPPAFAGPGVGFVLQPNQSYTLQVNTTTAGDQLAFSSVDVYGNLHPIATLSSQPDSSGEYFPLQSTLTTAQFFVGRLVAAGGVSAAPRIAHISLANVNPVESHNLSVHLFMVGRFANLPDTAAENSFAQSFLSQLTAIYDSFSVTLKSSYELVPDTQVAMPFGDTFVDLPGQRIPGDAHLYMVNSIYQSGAPISSEILGFAPREVVNLDLDPESRVLLSETGGTAADLATTAAHELGHFFGMRHPTATNLDLAADDDQSNQDDGMASTPLCRDMAMPKAGAAPAPKLVGPYGKPYCLFVKGLPTSCPSDCDINNLMFAFACLPAAQQRNLTTEQQVFFRRNMGLMQGL